MGSVRKTKHFEERLVERGIDIDHVKQAIARPDWTQTDFQGRIIVRKKIDESRTIKVVYCKQAAKKSVDPLIITAYYL